MTEDPIVDETRAARQRLVDRFDGDLDALWRHLREVEKTLDQPVIRRAPKRPQPVNR